MSSSLLIIVLRRYRCTLLLKLKAVLAYKYFNNKFVHTIISYYIAKNCTTIIVTGLGYMTYLMISWFRQTTTFESTPPTSVVLLLNSI